MKSQILAWSMILAVSSSCQTSDLLNMTGQKVDVSYQIPDGEITGPMTFDINGRKWSDNRILLAFDETAKVITLEGSQESATFEAPEWWSPLHSIEAVGSDLKIVNNNPTLFTMRSAEASYGEDHYNMSNFSLTCAQPAQGQMPLENCLQKGALRMSQFNMGSSGLVNQVLGFMAMNQSTTSLSNMELDFNRNAFTLEAKAKLSLTVTIKGEGAIEYMEASSPYDLRIRIDKFKASFLNIKDDLFNELKKSEGPNLKVAPPYIYVTFEQAQ